MPSRRELLATLGSGAAAALAGCGGDSASSTRSVGGGERPENLETDPEHASFRVPDGERGVRVETTGNGGDGDVPAATFPGRRIVASAKAAKQLVFADADGAAAAKTFLEGTDFESETVFLTQVGIGECYDVELCSVSWRSDHITTNFARLLRPADVACDADADTLVVMLIRIPAVLDPEQVNGFGSSLSSGGCREVTK